MSFRCAFAAVYAEKEQRNEGTGSSMAFRCAFAAIYVEKEQRKR
jgi:hypothetical protein